MNYLFIHQNFPGQYRHVVRHPADRPGKVERCYHRKGVDVGSATPPLVAFSKVDRARTRGQGRHRALNERGLGRDFSTRCTRGVWSNSSHGMTVRAVG